MPQPLSINGTPKNLRAKPDRLAREFNLKVIQPAGGCFVNPSQQQHAIGQGNTRRLELHSCTNRNRLLPN
jgi:hypothetical protein